MARVFPSLMSSERSVRVVVGYLLLLLLPPFLMLTFVAGKFQDLQEPAAMDQAQLARRVADGKGFTTDVIRPLSRAFCEERDTNAHPDLYNAPAYPVAEAAGFTIGDLMGIGASDKVVVWTGGVLWIIAVWLTFLVARSWFGWGIAMMAAFFYGSSVASLRAATDGSPMPLLTVFVLAALWVGVRRFRAEETASPDGTSKADTDISALRQILVGVFCAGAMLTHYVMILFALGFGVYVVTAQTRKIRALLLVLLGFALAMAPWLAHNVTTNGSAFFSLYTYEFASHTTSFPGDSIFRTTAPPSGALYFALTHPRDVFAKMALNIGQTLPTALRSLDGVVLLLLTALLLSELVMPRLRRLFAFMAFTLIAALVVSCMLRPEPQLVVAWAPLFAIGAAAFVSDWILDRVKPFSYGSLRNFLLNLREQDRPRWFGFLWRLRLGPRISRALVYLVFMCLTGIPLIMSLQWRPSETKSISQAEVDLLKKHLPEHAVVLTDQPALLAWRGQYRAVWLFQKDDAIERFERECGPIDAICVSSLSLYMSQLEWGDWWQWIGSPQGICRGFAPVNASPRSFVLRLRVKPPKEPNRELEQLLAELKKEPDSPDLHARLGAEYFRLDRLQEADTEFRRATELEPYNLEAFFGVQHIQARRADGSDVIGMARRILSLDEQDPNGMAVLRDAEKLLAQAVAVYPRNSWLLVQAGLCQAKMKRWEAAKDYYRAAAATAPKTLPLGLLLGNLYLQQGLISDAVAELQQLANEDEKNPVAHESLGDALGAQGKLQEALIAYEHSQELRPGWSRPYAKAGVVCTKLRRFDKAVEFYKKALELAPQSLMTRFYLAEAYTFGGKTADSIQQYEDILKDFPNHPWALNNLSDLYAQGGRDFPRAIELAQRAVQLNPQSDVIRDTSGWVNHLAGRHKEAIEDLQEAVRLAPRAGVYHYHLGKALLAVNRRDDALVSLRAALTCGLPPELKAETERLLNAP